MNRYITAADAEHVDLDWCHVEWLARPGMVEAKHLLLVRATFPPGEAHNYHFHPVHEEILYVLEGEMTQYVGEEHRVLKAGELAHIPAGLPHATYNTGSGTLRFLAILSPTGASGPDVVDCFHEEPWKTIRPPIPYPSQQSPAT